MRGILFWLVIGLVLSFTIVPKTVLAQLPAAYSVNVKPNYVRTWTAIKPDTSSSSFNTNTHLVTGLITTQYIDGIGVPFQTVVKKSSMVTGSTPIDMVTSQLYDEFGREQYKYLPFAANTTGGNSSISDGFFKLNPFQQDSAFNKGMFSDENYFYGKIEFESSPLKLVNKTMMPGDNWVGAGRGIAMKYWTNTSTDSVYIWGVEDVSNNFGNYDTNRLYAANQLYKNVIIDEHGKQVIEFKDKKGLIILKKVQLTAQADTGTGKGHYGWLCTYYIYDELNNLRCVIQPKGVELLAANSWNINYSSGIILNEQCFRYEYDKRNRMIMKKVPGAGKMWMVYDKRDRLVLTQDSIFRSNNQWFYTQYDGLNRSIATGIFTDNNNLSYHSVRADTSITYPWPGIYTVDTLTKTFYDDYTWRSGQGNPLNDTRSTTYDSYLQTASNTTWPYPQNATVQINQTKGMVTGSKTKILGTSKYLYAVSFYDDKARVIQAQRSNITDSIDIMTTQYTWANQAILTITKNKKAGTNAQTSVVLTQISYDSLMRVTKIEKRTSNTEVSSGSMPGSWTTIAQNEYDALGQLKKKKLGAEPLDSLKYDYNIRGWILGMNRGYVKDTTSTVNYFGFDLGYDKTSFTVSGSSKNYAAAQYNGNIGGLLWKSTGDDQLRKYDFTYDAVNRILSADFNQLTDNSFSKGAGIDFSLYSMSYDANGNILTMNHKGLKGVTSQTIDSLLYGYNSNSNKLNYVTDKANDNNSKLGDFKEINNNTSQDYSYDGNGNMYIDNNKDISYIHYNHLNLPDSIAVTNKGSIKYTYDATGNKLKKVTTEGAKITTTLYLFGNYINDTLQYLPQEEGRVRFNVAKTNLYYDYFIKDHLGNVRMVLTTEKDTSVYPEAKLENGTVANENIYYDNVYVGRMPRPASFYTQGSNGDTVQRLRQSTYKIGTGKLLKVMAKDRVHVKVDYFINNQGTDNTGADGLSTILSLLTDLLNSSSVTTAMHGSGSTITTGLSGSTPFTSFLSPQGGDGGSMPKAFLNIIFFDEQFKFVSQNSEIVQVSTKGSGQTITRIDGSAKEAIKNGYVYIFVSNESNNYVYFDNLQVLHERGPILEETHYYPFGLAMSGISTKALAFGCPQNKYKFNSGNELQSNEFDDNSGLELFDAINRMYDPQIGRFWQIDKLAESNWQRSPYEFALSNPIRFNDPLGLKEGDPNDPKVLQEVVVVSIPKRFWAKQRLYYDIINQLNRRGATIDQILQPSLREMMFRFDGITKFRERVNEKTHASDLYVWSAFFSPLIAVFAVEVAAPMIYQGGQWLFRVGTKYISLDKISALYKDASLEVWMRGNTILNGLKSEVIAAIAATLYKNNPAKWDKLMQQSSEFKDLMGPIINWIERQGQKPDGGTIPKAEDKVRLTVDKFHF